MKKIIILLFVGLNVLFLNSCEAQVKNAKTETVKVYGNCGMCKKTIEKAAYKKGKANVDWDVDTKMATITYNEKKTDVKEILQRIANVGYDNEMYRADDAVYDELHGCCQYDRKPQED